jgi:molybdate-binding protein
VHVAGVHLAPARRPQGNAIVVREKLGLGYKLLRVATWEAGVTFSPDLGLRSIRQAVSSRLRWVGREAGSGAQQCLDEVLGEQRRPRRIASDHHGVAEAVRNHWADAGVCVRLVSEHARLGFLPVREEIYEFCVPACWESDPRIEALVQVVRSASYRTAVGELPGYKVVGTGEMHALA